ncbi:MAG TPA: hypothetical protein ENG62_02740, partial [Thermoplasmatales archaeon]|nr:hypothetical protein [Thermoplasmatales archaeon]
DKWILSKYSKLVKKCTELMDSFDFSQTMKEIEYFLWHELADHYIEMAKAAIHNNLNKESIQYTLHTIGLGILKLFAPFFPHITEEIYQHLYKQTEGEKSIHISNWPTEILYDEEAVDKGEVVKDFIAKIRAYKSEQGIALNAPLPVKETYAPREIISTLRENSEIIKATLKLPDTHRFIEGKPDVKEVIVAVKPNPAVIGPRFKQEAHKIIEWIKQHQTEIIEKIQRNKDLTWRDLKELSIDLDEKLLEGNYITIESKPQIKGKEIVHREPFYLVISK